MKAFEKFKEEYLQPIDIVINSRKYKTCPFGSHTMIPLKTHTKTHKGLIKQSYLCETCGLFADFFEEENV